jgi:hypothetical protein
MSQPIQPKQQPTKKETLPAQDTKDTKVTNEEDEVDDDVDMDPVPDSPKAVIRKVVHQPEDPDSGDPDCITDDEADPEDVVMTEIENEDEEREYERKPDDEYQ